MPWPDFYPDDCPPEDAEPASGEVYRMIRGRTPQEKDFKSYQEMRGPDAEFSQPECVVCGISVYTDIEDISRMRARLQQRVPKLRERKFIAKGILNSSLGKILPTNNTKSHIIHGGFPLTPNHG